MAGNPIRMSQYKQILRLFSQGQKIKAIVRETGISRTTIKRYLRIISSRELNLEELLQMEDLRIEHLLQSPLKTEKERHQDFMMRLDKLQQELQHPHVTKQLLWEEYKREYPDGYQYSRFCYYMQLYDRSQKSSFIGKHNPGDKLYVDFTGDKLHYVDRTSGEIITCEVFVATMGYSNYMAVVATPSQKIEDVIEAHVKAFEYIGGCPAAIVPDNLKSVVQQAHRYEPKINEAFLDMANHYGMVVLPARAGKPKDKAKVERAVTISYQRIFAPLRKQTFYSLQELNTALQEQATLLNQRKMQEYECSREVLLERDERPVLRSLPPQRYQIKKQMILTVQRNNHVYLSKDKKYYSATPQFIGFKVHVIITASLVRLYYQGNCIATHAADQPGKYITVDEHMASHHRAVKEGMDEQVLKQRAASIGLPVLSVIEEVFKRSIHPEQAYKSCQGILSLAKKTSKEILIESCLIALEYQVCTYRNVERLAHGRYASREFLQPDKATSIPDHPNVRGASHYNP
ncbi:MAG: IS21 family transposase [Saprospiraceae bacterium]